MKEYIDREAVLNCLSKYGCDNGSVLGCHSGAVDCAEAEVAVIPAANVIELPDTGIGDLSDGYHTFNELYHHRAVLFSVICNLLKEKAWKSKLHDAGDMYEGMFIAGIETPMGQATYHYDINPYWDIFNVKELERAPKWDGHTTADSLKRICSINFNETTWFHIDERKPDINEDVMMYFDSGNMAVGFMSDQDEDFDYWCAYTDDGWYTSCDCPPVYWAEKPNSPDEVMDENDTWI